MMGEFLLYSNGVLFGGIYDDRLLVKIVPENTQYDMPESIPYDGAKPMDLVEDVDDEEKLAEIVETIVFEPEFFTGSPDGERQVDVVARLCMVVDWCLEHPEYTAKIKVIPKKDYPVLMPCTF